MPNDLTTPSAFLIFIVLEKRKLSIHRNDEINISDGSWDDVNISFATRPAERIWSMRLRNG